MKMSQLFAAGVLTAALPITLSTAAPATDVLKNFVGGARVFTPFDVGPIPAVSGQTDGTSGTGDVEDDSDSDPFDGKLFKHCRQGAMKCPIRVLPVDKTGVTPSPARPNQVVCTLIISSGVIANRSNARFVWFLKRDADGFRFTASGIELIPGDGSAGFQPPKRLSDIKYGVPLETSKRNNAVNYKLNVERFDGNNRKIGVCEPYDPVIINQD